MNIAFTAPPTIHGITAEWQSSGQSRSSSISLAIAFSRYDADDLLFALTATRELFLTLAKECASAYGYTTGIPEIDS